MGGVTYNEHGAVVCMPKLDKLADKREKGKRHSRVSRRPCCSFGPCAGGEAKPVAPKVPRPVKGLAGPNYLGASPL